MQIDLQVDLLKACLVVAPKKDVRFYLNGIHIETKAGHVVYTATDGHRLFTARHCLLPEEESQTCNTILPRDGVEQACKIATAQKRSIITLESVPDVPMLMLGDVRFAPVDGTFPEWRRVVPQRTSGEPGQYNPKYLLDAKAALARAQGLTANAPFDFIVQYNGETGAAICRGRSTDALAVVMPVRDVTKDKVVLEPMTWATL